MSAKKSIFVTAAMTAMLIVIMICLLALKYKVAFFAIGGIFATIGLISTAVSLCGWMMETREEELSPVVVNEEAPEPPQVVMPGEVTATVEEIMKEVKA